MKILDIFKKLPEYAKVIKIALDVMNGKKLNTGAVMLLAVFVMQQIGIGESEAKEIFNNCFLAFGSILTVWGYIHRLIKANKQQPEEQK